MNAAPDPKTPLRVRLISRVRPYAEAAIGFIRRRPLLTLGGGGAALLLIIASAISLSHYLAVREVKISKASLEQGLIALEEGRLEDARTIAVQLRALNKLPPDDRGGPALILGKAMAITAASAPNADEERNLYEIAVRYLREASDIGFPPGFEAEGSYRFGDALFHIERYAESIPHLQTALKLKHPAVADIHQMLATAYFLDNTPDLNAALRHNQQLLSLKNLTDETLENALLQQAEIAFRLDDATLLANALDQLPPASKSSPISLTAKLLRARALFRESQRSPLPSEAAAQRAQARTLLQEVLESSKSQRSFQAEACFFLGKIDFAEQKLDSALSLVSRARRLASGSSLVIAATLEEGDIHLARAGNPTRVPESVLAYRRVLKSLDPQTPFVNPWVTPDEIIERAVAAIESLLADREYAAALDLNAALSLATDSPEALRLTGRIEMEWGRALMGDAPLKGELRASRRELARVHLLRAAQAHQALAERSLATGDYAPLMHQAALLYEEGGDFESARKALVRTLDVQGRNDRPETLVMLGKVLLDLDRLDEAVSALAECYLAHRRNPVSYRARLLASQALMEKGDLEEARKLLHTNLWEEDLSPESADWRDSLFALADLLYVQARVAYTDAKEIAASPTAPNSEIAEAFDAAARLFEEAAQRLSEAVLRYEDAEQAVLARYQLAECNRALSRNKMRLRDAHPIQSAQAQLDRESKAYLQAALDDLNIVQTQLNQRADVHELSLAEQKLLRNCYFLIADCLFDQQKYEEAIQAYADAAGRYQSEPASIEAFAQIAACYRRLKRPSDERTALQQAQFLLARLPGSADFAVTTRASRGDWNDYLNWRLSAP